jgi:hypothetical protein
VPVDKQQEYATLGSSDALQKLMQKEVKAIRLNELNAVYLDNFTGILDITVSEKTDKNFVDNIHWHFDKLSKYDNCFVVALNFENCFEKNEESNLLRFLGYLTYEYKQTFIIYNLEFEVYEKMIDDNAEFAKTRSWESFWHKDKAMLVYTKTPNKDFYFADILYGKLPDNYYSVNNRLNHTFPNSASIVDANTQKAQPDSNAYLPDLFDNNVLLPYDVLLKNRNKKLALCNIETLLQNNLFHDEMDSDLNAYTAIQILENYVDNFDGYHITNTHFKIGNKIHSSDFYYAKRLFQNSFYTTRLAMNLAKEITKTNNDKTKPITLVGYEMYSELILSLTENYLTEIFDYGKVIHFVAQRKDDIFEFLPKDTFSNYIKEYEKSETIIIVPIAATSSTSQKIEKEIREQIYKQEKANGKSKEEAEQKRDDKALLNTRYNVILAQDRSEKFNNIRNDDENQQSIIELPAK